MSDDIKNGIVEDGIEKEGFSVPKECIDKFDDYVSAIEARNKALDKKYKFQYKKAIYFGRIAYQLRREFWDMIYSVYPEFKDKKGTFRYDKWLEAILFEEKKATSEESIDD